ncbi:hypothetical protein BSKO_10633 [Bryopsis sp. KO-2023]|nr:hypothetical protein BSKO_10633 [Bryopsis sp. KO-2023]
MKTDAANEICASPEPPSPTLGHMRMILDIGRTIPALLHKQLLALPEAPLQQIHEMLGDAREVLLSQAILSGTEASKYLNFSSSTNAVYLDEEALQNTLSSAGQLLEKRIGQKVAAIADIVNGAMELALLASPNEYHGKVCGGHVNLIQLNKHFKQTVAQWSSECRGAIAFHVATSHQAPKAEAIAELLRERQLDTASGSSSSEGMVDSENRKWSPRWISIDKATKTLLIRQTPESAPIHEINLRHMRSPETTITASSGKCSKRAFTLRPLDSSQNSDSYAFKAPSGTLRNMWLQDVADCCGNGTEQRILSKRERDNEACYVAHGIMFVSCENTPDIPKRSQENQWRACEDGSLLAEDGVDRDAIQQSVSLALGIFAEKVKNGLVEPVFNSMRRLLVDRATNPEVVGDCLIEYMCEAVDGATKENMERTQKKRWMHIQGGPLELGTC